MRHKASTVGTTKSALYRQERRNYILKHKQKRPIASRKVIGTVRPLQTGRHLKYESQRDSTFFRTSHDYFLTHFTTSLLSVFAQYIIAIVSMCH